MVVSRDSEEVVGRGNGHDVFKNNPIELKIVMEAKFDMEITK